MIDVVLTVILILLNKRKVLHREHAFLFQRIPNGDGNGFRGVFVKRGKAGDFQLRQIAGGSEIGDLFAGNNAFSFKLLLQAVDRNRCEFGILPLKSRFGTDGHVANADVAGENSETRRNRPTEPRSDGERGDLR